MATIGGNLLQRTRCRYFRDPTVPACNKRTPGSGCAAVAGAARMHAILGASEHCIALHASDLCVAAGRARRRRRHPGRDGQRSVPLTQFYRPARRTARHRERARARRADHRGYEIPLLPAGTRSGYLKVRDRASYEFALTSAAAALVIEDGTIVEARARARRRRDDAVAGARGRGRSSPAHPPPAERSAPRRRPRSLTRSPSPGTAFKVELAKRTIVRILQTVSGVRS